MTAGRIRWTLALTRHGDGADREGDKIQNTFYTGDNLYVLRGLNSGIVDIVYLDPPFNSGRAHAAPAGSRAAGASFNDRWTWRDVDEDCLGALVTQFPAAARFIAVAGAAHGDGMMAYLAYMAQRIIEMRRVLKDTGSLYLHCDPTASHYLKVLLDCIFGREGFNNEIVWRYQTGGVSRRRFGRKHDAILWYAKTGDYAFYPEAVRVPRTEKSLKRLAHPRGARTALPDKYADDVFEIQALNAQAKERTGYPTQKPLALLNRIILASSREGDVVLDPFSGCATTCVAAQWLGRAWIGIDIESRAKDFLVERLSAGAEPFTGFVALDTVPARTDVTATAPTAEVTAWLLAEQRGRCNGCGTVFAAGEPLLDLVVPVSKGGTPCRENYQLLCPPCARLKAARPLDFLRRQLDTHEAASHAVRGGCAEHVARDGCVAHAARLGHPHSRASGPAGGAALAVPDTQRAPIARE